MKAKAFDRSKLMRQLERERRQKVRARLSELRQLIKAARRSKREAIKLVRTQCRDARKKLRSVCAMRVDRAKVRGVEQIEGARRELAREAVAEQHTRSAIRRSEGQGPSVRKTSAAERRQESDDAVRSNIPRELAGVFERVKRHIKGSQWQSRTESFLQWAHDNPGEVYAIQSEQAERELSKLIAERERYERELSQAVPF